MGLFKFQPAAIESDAMRNARRSIERGAIALQKQCEDEFRDLMQETDCSFRENGLMVRNFDLGFELLVPYDELFEESVFVDELRHHQLEACAAMKAAAKNLMSVAERLLVKAVELEK